MLARALSRVTTGRIAAPKFLSRYGPVMGAPIIGRTVVVLAIAAAVSGDIACCLCCRIGGPN